MVFYRKYRPQNFDELIGQDHVKKNLLSAFQNEKLAHAYLFCGPRGSGKTSTARILAKLVNCELVRDSLFVHGKKAAGDEQTNQLTNNLPCNKCEACISITDGSNMDLIEIDAASNRGIDDIRDLREKIKLAPSSLKKKVYIIDEVHMLTTEAFNALLKTLEEPPAHVLFILATTEVQKLPDTILSRVQRFDFKLATIDEIKQALKNICQKEKLEVGDDILALIAKSSEGSFRDAVKMLDQVASNGPINIDEARKLISASSDEEVLELIDSLFVKDSVKALKIIQDLNNKGTAIKDFTNLVLRVLREILLIKTGAFDASPELKAVVAKASTSELVSFIENIQKSLEQLKYTSIPSLPLEVAIIKSVSSIKYQVSSEAQIQSVIPGDKPGIQSNLPGSQIKSGMTEVSKIPSEPIPSVETMQFSDDVVVITDKWTYILETIRPYNYSLEALLKQAKVKNCDGVNVILEVPYSFHQRILEAPKSRTLLESVLADVLGKSVKVTTVLGKREVKASELANVEVAQDDEIVRLAAEIFNS